MMGPACGLGGGCPAPTTGVCDEACTLPMAKPIRIFQFLFVTALFALTIYTISRNSPYQQVEGILLTVLFGSFLFIALIDIISQFGGDPIPDTPMFLFGVVGTLLFLMAAGGIFFISRREEVEDVWRLTVSTVLAAACSLLFLLDVLLIFLYGY
ncbi:uncharacterized protein LOC105701079 [Orussus abietinus]|uniref:uncharacterized protein LOC105701079 n=1 Tax=Orussus abietinus TaxID=222816 RepID=UPI0006267240|nr:uncharacterized protein LOC105701079 [Orussus abietinus]